MRSKSGQEASTLVWIAATFIILLILIIYFIMATVIYVDKDSNEVIVEKSISSDLSLLKEHLSLLKLPVEKREAKLESLCSDYQLIIPGEETFSKGSLKVYPGQLEGQIGEIEPSFRTSFIKVLYKDQVQYSTYKKLKTC